MSFDEVSFDEVSLDEERFEEVSLDEESCDELSLGEVSLDESDEDSLDEPITTPLLLEGPASESTELALVRRPANHIVRSEPSHGSIPSYSFGPFHGSAPSYGSTPFYGSPRYGSVPYNFGHFYNPWTVPPEAMSAGWNTQFGWDGRAATSGGYSNSGKLCHG